MSDGRSPTAVIAPPGLGWVRRVRVGTTNAPKIGAAREALRPFAPDACVEGVAVDSGVPEQPVGLEEVLRGATRRARAALASGADLGVGIEDGLIRVPLPDPEAGEGGGVTDPAAGHLNVGWAVVTDGTRTGCGLSSGFAYPPGPARRALDEREPIGPLFDRFWRDHRDEPDERAPDGRDVPSGESVGNVGKLTNRVLVRREYGRHAVVCALVRFLHPDLYGDAVDAPAASPAGPEGGA